MKLTSSLRKKKRALKTLLVALGIFYLFASTLPKHGDYWVITNISMAFAVDPLHFMAGMKGVAYPPTFYALQASWLKLGSYLFHYNLTINYDLTNSTFYANRQTSFGIFPFWGMIPISAALFLLVGASYAVLKNKWLSLLCLGPITFVTVVLMGQIDVVCVLFIFVSLILMQKALNAEKYFSLLLLAFLGLGVSMQLKTYGGLLLPTYLIYTLALAKHKKLELKKALFMLFTCFVAFLVAALLVWAPYPEWFDAIILRGESNWLLQLPSPLFQVPIWALGYALILCYIAVSVLRNPKRALWDSRYFIFHNFAIVAWFFVAVFTQPQWWMFLVPIAILALDNFKSKYGVFCCIFIFIVYLFYPMAMYFNMVGSFTSYLIPAVLLTKSLSGWVFTLLAGALLFWVFELKRELGNMGRRSDNAL